MNQNHHNKPRKVLVVDDDPIIRDMMVDILDFEGYAISTARHGLEALEILRGDERYLVFLDVMMPVLDGWGFVERVRKLPAGDHVPIVVMSAAHRIQESAERLRRAGVSAVLAKPFDSEALIAIVQRYAPVDV